MTSKLRCLIILGTFFIIAVSATNKIVRIPIYSVLSSERHRNPRALLSVAQEKRRNVDFTFTDLHNTLYYGVLAFGTPSQYATVQFDTGSAVLWIVSSDCRAKVCSSKSKFDSGKSKTFVKNSTQFSVQYHVGSSQGVIGKDIVKLGPLEIKNQLFGLASSISADFETSPYSGVCGLAFKRLSALQNPTLLDNMYDQNLISSYTFSMYMRKTALMSFEPNNGSMLIFGGVDPDFYVPPLRYHRVKNPMWWTINLRTVRFGETVITSDDATNCFPDSGSSFLVGPWKAVNEIYRIIGAVQAPNGFYTVDCNGRAKLSNITFEFRKQSLNLTQSDYVLSYRNNQNQLTCIVGIQASHEERWTLGAVFMSRYYTVFDAGNERVGFALSRQNYT